MSLKTCTFTLKQHTMLLQPEDYTGCLRATEVKPKLDRFLQRRLGISVKDKNLNGYSNWIQSVSDNGEDVSFRYKMRIKLLGSIECYESRNPDRNRRIPNIYYGNMGNGSRTKGYSCEDGMELHITCFIPELMEKITENIQDFFIVTNFGTMQGKGFGSFTVEGTEISHSNVKRALLAEYGIKKKCYRIERPHGQRVFDCIKDVYTSMKTCTGERIDRRRHQEYKHSALYNFYSSKNQNIGNEKKYMKVRRISPNLQTNHHVEFCYNLHKSNENYRYVRGLLGIGQAINYITDDTDESTRYKRNRDGSIQKDRRDNNILRKEKIEISAYGNDIARVASPILFKVINGNIYMIAREINENIYNKEFKFAIDSRDRKRRQIAQVDFVTLKIPSKEEFDIDEFMKYFITFFNRECTAMNGYIIREVRN
ncbi:hypothetical protein P261_00111 [Lachnospiraceae bacterium TWA4]|nr:hypothetical protein P261_00111 [Lachnospiraceae bacterium TWA4]